MKTFLAVIALSAMALGQLVNGPRGFPVPNEGSTGTVLNGTAIVNASGQAIAATTGNTAVPTYIVIGGAGTTGSADLASTGITGCTMDSTIASGAGGYYVITSTTAAHQCHAQAAAPGSGTCVIGYLVSQSTASGSMALVSISPFVFGGSGGGNLPTGVANGSALVSNGVGQPGVYQAKPVIDVRDKTSCGVSDDTTAFNTLLSAIGSVQTGISLSCQVKLSNITIPSNVTLNGDAGGSIFVATGQTVTIQGPINAGPRQIFFNMASGQGATSFSGNRTLTRISPLWWGLDCTGATDNAPVWQQIMSFTGDNSTYVIPQNCIDSHASQVNVSSRAGFKLLSETRAQSSGGNTQRPIERWSCTSGCTGGMWNFIANQTPTIEGFLFDNHTGTPGTIAYFLNFDGNPSTYIGTEATLRYNTFENDQSAAVQAVQSPPFSAIQINLVSGQNHEKNVITDSDFACSQSIPFRESDSGQISSSTNVLTCGAANCTYTTDAAIGDRLRVRYATGLLDTTISSITDNNHLVFAAANGGSNQSNARVHFRQAYGYGITIGSVNAKHNTLERLSFTQCNRGLYVINGSFNAKHIGGTFNDVTAWIGNISEPSEIEYMETESSLREVQTGTSLDSPLTLRHMRNSIGGSAESDGFIFFNNSGGGSRIFLSESQLQATPITNSVLIRAIAPQNMQLYSSANQWAPGVATTTNLGFSTFQNQPQTNSNWLISCGDFGITDMNASSCFNFGGISPTLSGADVANAVNYGCSPANTAVQNATCVTNAFTALYANGGGALYFPLATAPYKIGCFTYPNDGISNSDGVFSTKPFRIFSSATSIGYKAQAYGATLDLPCNTNARISLLAVGGFEIDHITLINGNTAGGDTVPFILDIDGVLNIHDTTFIGDTSLVGTANLQDAIVLGNGGSTPGNTVTSAFYGYVGTINHNFFDHVRRAIYANGSGSWSINSMFIAQNQIWSNSGCSLTPCFAFDFGTDGVDFGNIFVSNLFDGNSITPVYSAAFGVRGGVNLGNQFISNTAFDNAGGTVFQFGVSGVSNASGNLVVFATSGATSGSTIVNNVGTSTNCLLSGTSLSCGKSGAGSGIQIGDIPNPFLTGDTGAGYPALWSGGVAPSGTNYGLTLGPSGDTYLNGGSDVYQTIAGALKTHLTSTTFQMLVLPKFSGTNTGGSTTFAPGGANCPAVGCVTPYTWIQAISSDGSTVYIPVFK